MTVPLDREPAGDRAEALARRGLEYMPPALPGLAPGAVRRWRGQPTWQPPETTVLVRHRAIGRPDWVAGNQRDAPDGYEIDYDVGLVQVHEQPGTRLLVERDGEYDLADAAVPLPDGTRALGHIEQAALPMMHELELRQVPETGRQVLVAGPADPLRAVTDHVRRLGFVEGYPIEPRELVSPPLPAWNFTLLARLRDADRWRHGYDTMASGTELAARDGLALGSLWMRPGPGMVQLRRDGDGRVRTGVSTSAKGRTGRILVDGPKWVAAPLGWSRPPAAWALRATASRARHVARGQEAARHEQKVLGYLRTAPTVGCSPLFSAVHPALPDQYLTRSTIEAKDMGYRVEGVLGYIADIGAARAPGPREVLWGSRFGKSRRYVEG